MEIKKDYLKCIQLLAQFTIAMVLFGWISGCQPGQPSRNDWNGAWTGTVEQQPFPDLITLNIDSSALVKLFYTGIDYTTVSDLAFEGNSIKFKIDETAFEAIFEGNMVDGDSIVGTLEVNGEKYHCGFVRTVPMGLGEATEYNGFYRLAPGHVVEVSPYILDFTLNPLTILDYKTGEKRLAYPKGKEIFVAGKRLLVPYPPAFSFEFIRQDSSILFQYKGKKRQGLMGERLADLTNQQEIVSTNGEVELFGTITYPASLGPHPLVVYVPGSGRQFRGNMPDDFVKLLPYYGIATLLYDKRGCGSSTGNLEDGSYDNFANDLEAVLETAAQTPGIDPEKIGFLGIGQAGLIMPMVAARNPKVKFMVNISGSVFDMEQQEYQACALRMRADGFEEEAIEAALAYQRQMFGYLKGKVDAATLQKASQEAAQQSWAGYVTLFSNKDYIAWWRENHDFSAVPFLQKLTIPQLAIYGEQDLLVPPAQNAPKMQEILQQGGHPLNQLEVFPKANHLLLLGEKRGDFQLSEIEGYPEGLFELINEWVGDAVGLK